MDEGRTLAAALPDWAAAPDAQPGSDESPDAEASAMGAATGAHGVAALIAAYDAERGRAQRQQRNAELLERSNRALRRELLGLRVRHWRDEETIERLEQELAAARQARDDAVRRGRQLTGEFSAPHQARWRPSVSARGAEPLAPSAARRPVLPGSEPFFRRGFRLAEGTAIVGTTVQRAKAAPAGVLVFGPYVKLTPGIYAAEIEARLHRLLPVYAGFTVEAVCDGARQVVERRRFGLRSAAGWRRFELVFSIWEGDGRPDYEVRVWAASGTPLAIRRIELYRLDETPAAMTQPAVAAHCS